MGTYVEHNGKEINGIKKLKYLTIFDIIEGYFLIPISDVLYKFLKVLNNLLKRWKQHDG